jgi:hypothetical protein
MKLICEDAKEINKDNILKIVKSAVSKNNFYMVPSAAVKNDAAGNSAPSSTPEGGSKAICLRINSLGSETTQKLKDIFFQYKGDYKVLLSVLSADGRKKIQTDYAVVLSDECREALEGVVGRGNLEVMGS